MYSANDDAPKCTGFPHSDIAGYNGSYHLTGAFRRLARPSSPLTARASTVYACSLNLTTRRSLRAASLRDSDTLRIPDYGEMQQHVCFNFQLVPDC